MSITITQPELRDLIQELVRINGNRADLAEAMVEALTTVTVDPEVLVHGLITVTNGDGDVTRKAEKLFTQLQCNQDGVTELRTPLHVMPSGKYMGLPLNKIPAKYLLWYALAVGNFADPEVQDAAMSYLKERYPHMVTEESIAAQVEQNKRNYNEYKQKKESGEYSNEVLLKKRKIE